MKKVLFFIVFIASLKSSYAQYADGTGTSTFQRDIFWLGWNSPALVSRPAGASATNVIASATPYIWEITPTIRVSVVLSSLSATSGGLTPYISGSYSQDGLHVLFPNIPTVGTVGHSNIGLANTSSGAQVSFTVNMDLQLLINGVWTSVSYPGMVVGDAESMDNVEFITGTTTGPVQWQVLDIRNGAGADSNAYKLQVSLGGTRFRLSSTVSNPGFQPVMYAHGASTLTDVTVKGSGISALAVGFVTPFDFGDAPSSYGAAGNFIDSFDFAAGITDTTSTIAPHYALASRTRASLVPKARLYIGSPNVDADGNAPSSTPANIDDGTGSDDDDAALPPIIKVNQNGDVVITVNTTNTLPSAATLYAWVDFDRDGKFESTELISVAVPASSASTARVITFPNATFAGAIKSGVTYVRLRLTTSTLVDDVGTTNIDERSTGAAANGETEDHFYTISGITISGTVLNDPTGLTNSIIDGSGIGTVAGNRLYAYLVDSASNLILDSVAVNTTTGSYSFLNKDKGNYIVALSTNNVAIGSNISTIPMNLPSQWVATGEGYGTNNLSGTGIEVGAPDGRIKVSTPPNSLDVPIINFGVQQRPTPTAVTTPTRINPGGTATVNISSFFTGIDSSGGVIDSFRITAFPTNATSITIGGTTYTSGTWPVTGVAFAVGAVVNLDPIDGAVTSVMPFSATDNAGFASTGTANMSVPFILLPPTANHITAPRLNNSTGAIAIPSFQASSPSGAVIDSFFAVTVPDPSTQGTLHYCSSVSSPCPIADLVAVTAGMKLTAAQSDRLLFDPLPTFTGNVNFTYNVRDANGLLSNTATYTIPVYNNPPVTINIRTTRLIDTTDLFYLPKLVGADADGTVSSYSISNVPATGAVLYYCVSGTLPSCTPTAIPSGAGPTVLTAAQMLTLQVDPTTGFTGDFIFNYTATDNNSNVSNVSTYTIPIGPVSWSGYGNQPPVATNITAQNINNSAGATAIPNLLGTDPDGTVVLYTIGSSVPNTVTQGTLSYCTTPPSTGCGTAVVANQTMTPAQAATLSFDPVPSFIGTATFTYTATDNDGVPLTSAPATYNIPIVNQPPVANPDRVAPIANTLVTPTLLPPLTGSDYDGTVVSYNITSVPAASSGTLQYCATPGPGCALSTISGPLSSLTPAQVATLNFIPNSSFTGDYIFNFTTVDNNGLVSLVAPFTVPVVATASTIGQPPIAYSFNAPAINSTAGATLLTGALTGTDPDGTIASYTIASIPPSNEGVLTYCVTPPATGCGTAVTVGLVLTSAQAATISFDPNANFTGTSTFTYTNLDNSGNLSNIATVTIPVSNNPPVSNNVNNTSISRLAGATSLNPLSSVDADGSVVSYTILTIPAVEDGILRVCTTAPSTGCVPVTVGQVLTPAQISQLAFTPVDTTHSPIVSFLYSTTDNNGNLSNVAVVNIPMFDAIPLPIELLEFKAQKNGKNAFISWKTGVEKVGIEYQLQHSLNGQNWTMINNPKAKAEQGSDNNSYNYLHTNLSNGTQYYRLKVVDVDSKYTYSPVRTLSIDNELGGYSIMIHPNPVTDNFIISTSDLSVMSEVSVYSNEGKLIQEFSQVNSGTNVSMSNYSSGFYIIKIKDKNGEMQVMKLMKK